MYKGTQKNLAHAFSIFMDSLFKKESERRNVPKESVPVKRDP